MSLLARLSLAASEQRLQQGATYVDLADPERGEFRATGEMSAGAESWYVPKDRVPYPIWNRLIGIRNPERLDEDTGTVER